MPTTYPEAYDTITARVLAEWPALSALIVGSAVEMRFEDVEQGQVPETYFCRFAMRPGNAPQVTFRTGSADGSQQRYTHFGVIFIQVFSPRKDKRAAERQRLLGEAARSIFRGKSFDGCIVFRNVRVSRLDPEQSFLRANVVAEYEFDEIG